MGDFWTAFLILLVAVFLWFVIKFLSTTKDIARRRATKPALLHAVEFQAVINAQSVRRRRCLFLHPPGICLNTPFESLLSGPTVFGFEIAQEYPPRVPVSRLAQRLRYSGRI